MAKKTKNLQYYEAVGRRKESVARVRLYVAEKSGVLINGKKLLPGQISINNQSLEVVCPRLVDRKRFLLPLESTSNLSRFTISILVKGGGKNGQIDAMVHGIARALVLVNPEQYKQTLKKQGLVTRDPRAKERRKVGTGGKARRKKQSPKR